MAIELPSLPYALDALEPHISRQTLEYHYGKHHQGYVTKLNTLLQGTSYTDLSLDALILRASEDQKTAIFNNAAQVWNHTFFWQSMSPQGGGEPSAFVAEKLTTAFGGVDAFKQAFQEAAVGLFGSGWVWLVVDQDHLKIVPTSNADSPLLRGQKPLLVLDVWEHAYYLDYQNRRPDFVNVFLTHLIHWKLIEQRLT